jgi:hypothetical protein
MESTPIEAISPDTCLTIRLSDAKARRRQTKLIYPHHQLSPLPKEAARQRSL